jgi:hypothetical protein
MNKDDELTLRYLKVIIVITAAGLLALILLI